MSHVQGAAELHERLEGIGDRLREERLKAGLSQSEMARKLGISASTISQLETGASQPSLGTLLAIVTELDVSLDWVIRGHDYSTGDHGGSPVGSDRDSPVVRQRDRHFTDLASGVRWEQLIAKPERGIDFHRTIYEVGGASASHETLRGHKGREFGYVVVGTLGVQINTQEYVLEPGDSIAFDSTEPHRLYNKGDEKVEAIWFAVGRGTDVGGHDCLGR